MTYLLRMLWPERYTQSDGVGLLFQRRDPLQTPSLWVYMLPPQPPRHLVNCAVGSFQFSSLQRGFGTFVTKPYEKYRHLILSLQDVFFTVPSVQRLYLEDTTALDFTAPDLNGQHNEEEAGGVQLAPRPKSQMKTPPMFRVILLNDDFTPMDFVVDVLKNIFNHNNQSATEIMMQVHHKGAGVAGVFTHEIAETKVHLVHKNARRQQYPLRCIMEKE